MPDYPLQIWLGALTGLGFVFALGCIVGSFLNVVVYRVPAGIGLIRPSSRCPHCETPLTWRENLPVLGWILLRGRCRFCRSPISIQYPIIELLVGVLFALLFVLWFMEPSPLKWIGLNEFAWRPDWARDGLVRTWPMLLNLYVLLGALVAVTLIDARTFMIPLSIPWTAGLFALALHPLHAAWISTTRVPYLRQAAWTIPLPNDSGWLGAALGGGAGLLVSLVLLRLRIIPQSFADYEAWERAHVPDAQAQAPIAGGASPATERTQPSTPAPAPPSAPPGASLTRRVLLLTGPAVALMVLGFAVGLRYNLWMQGMILGGGVGLIIGLVLRRNVDTRAHEGDPEWLEYPHARREVLKELLFLLPIAALGALGWWLARAPVVDEASRVLAPGGPMAGLLADAPLWLRALGGSVLGLLAGGAIVWLIRIPATLAFGREAMGLGDVHLMACVGAALGWIDPIAAFFVAPFIALLWTAGTWVIPALRRSGSAIPFGPHLAAATVAVVIFRPALEGLLSAIVGHPVNLG